MDAFLIILMSLWFSPIISLVVAKLTVRRPKARRLILSISVACTIFALLGLFTKVSTTITVFDWLMVSSVYLTLSFILYLGLYAGKFLKIISVILMVAIFGIGYIAGTVGALGVGFVVGEYDVERNIWLEDGLIYKESILGNAVSDHRGLKIEIYRTIPWLPILEWQVAKSEYNILIRHNTPISVSYDANESKIVVQSSIYEYDGKRKLWSDTLFLN